MKFADSLDRQRRRLELSGIESSEAVSALLREIVSAITRAEAASSVPTWMIEMLPELDARHAERMRMSVARMALPPTDA